MDLIVLFFSAAIINNFVLTYFLGICPFIGVSHHLSPAISLGLATVFVMSITSVVSWLIYNHVLIPYELQFLQIPAFILVIASLVHLVEMFVRKASATLYRSLGIYLPLITTNCAIMGVAFFLTKRQYSLEQSVVFGLGAGAGFTLALTLMASIREELNLADVPAPFRGAPITLLVAGILAMAFMGFTGIE